MSPLEPVASLATGAASGKTRPIGISTFEDKLVQDAVREVLEPIYEQDFLSCSYGFRTGRSAHDAVRTLKGAVNSGRVRWILEADIVSYFDSIDRKMLMEFIRNRVADESLMRLVGRCLHVGVLDGGEYSEPDVGAAQGSVLSPLLGNIYLHYVTPCVRAVRTDSCPRSRCAGSVDDVQHANVRHRCTAPAPGCNFARRVWKAFIVKPLSGYWA